jgi:importin-7
MFNALTALRKLIKKYEYAVKEERTILDEVVRITFPYLQTLLKTIIHHQSLEAAQVMKLCFKIFYSATVYALPKVDGVDVSLWFTLIATLMNKELPEAEENKEPYQQPKDYDQRKLWPWWKLKKWLVRIMTNFISRYGNPRYAATENQTFAEYFKNSIAVQLLEPALTNLMWKANGKYISDEVHRQCLAYLVSAAEMAPTYKYMKQHLSIILIQIIFPTLCITTEDIEVFNDDPSDFVRRVYDPLSDWLSPTVAATNLLQMLGRFRKKDTLPIFLPFLQCKFIFYCLYLLYLLYYIIFLYYYIIIFNYF